MDNYLEQIKTAIVKPLAKLDITVDDVNYQVNNKYKFLNIVLDKVGGLDMDAICEATNIINPIIDEMKIDLDDYILDISSKERNGN